MVAEDQIAYEPESAQQPNRYKSSALMNTDLLPTSGEKCVWQEFCRHIGMSESTLWHRLMLTVLPDAGW